MNARSLNLAISPYHLSTREAPAMAALLLADRAVTLLPRPSAGTDRTAVRAAMERAPRFLRLLESWRWSSPLWRDGTLSGAIEGATPESVLTDVYERIARRDELRTIHRLAAAADAARLHDEPGGSGEDGYLDALCADVLRGGPDPGYSIPIICALDEFSARHGCVAVRTTASSVAEKAEARLSKRVFSSGVPVLIRASGRTLSECRQRLAGPLKELRGALSVMFMQSTGAAGGGLEHAALRYAKAFEDWWSVLPARDDDAGERITVGYVSITGVLLPLDATLRCGQAAMRTLQPIGRGAGMARPKNQTQEDTTGGQFSALVIRELSIKPLNP